jgi:aryl-alcohol dehydrogenase-like predicted oxidoreductase
MQAHTFEMLDAAWNAGIRYFDVARSYGLAETFLGAWLRSRRIPSDEIAVASKWGYTYTANWQVEIEEHEVKEHSLAVLNRQIGESRGLLGDYLSLYQVHSATLDSHILDNSSVLDRLAELKDDDLLIGLTLSGPNQAAVLEKAMDIERDGLLFDSVQATWNLLEPSCGPSLEAAQRQGMIVIIKEALANGRLTARNQDEGFHKKRAVLMSVAEGIGVSIDTVALAAALAQPWADAVLSGAATVEQLHSNLRALEIKASGEYLEKLIDLVETPEEYWGKRSSLLWN